MELTRSLFAEQRACALARVQRNRSMATLTGCGIHRSKFGRTQEQTLRVCRLLDWWTTRLRDTSRPSIRLLGDE